MKRFILKSVLFFAALVAGYCILVLAWGLYAPSWMQKNLVYKLGHKGHSYTRFQEVKKTNDIDLLFIGSSLCMRGFDTRIFESHGYKTFNLGSGGQSPVQTLWLLKQHIDHLKPELVVVEVNPYILSRDGVEPGLDLISNHDFEFSLADMVITTSNIKMMNTLIYSMMRQALGLNRDFTEERVRNDDTYVDGGFVEKKVERFDVENFWKEDRYILGPVDYQMEALKEIVDLLNKKNIPHLLVQPPVTSFLLKEHQKAFEVDTFFTSIGRYINFNPHTYLNDTLHFFDSRHLNQEGVEIFNTVFIEEVLEMGQ